MCFTSRPAPASRYCHVVAPRHVWRTRDVIFAALVALVCCSCALGRSDAVLDTSNSHLHGTCNTGGVRAGCDDGLVLLQRAAGILSHPSQRPFETKDLLEVSDHLVAATSLWYSDPHPHNRRTVGDRDASQTRVAQAAAPSRHMQLRSAVRQPKRNVFGHCPQAVSWLLHHAVEAHAEKPSTTSQPSEEGTDEAASSDTRLWFGLSLCSLIVVDILLWLYIKTTSEPVDLPVEEEWAIIRAKGRDCWNYICVALCVLLPMAVYFITALSVEALNLEIEETPIINETVGSQVVEVQRFPMKNEGPRAFEAAGGMVLTLAVALITLFQFKLFRVRQVTASLLAQFVLRGATLSLFLALVLEILGQLFLTSVGMAAREAANVATLFMMLIVGFSEELGKLLAATCGTCLTVNAVRNVRSRGGCCGGCVHGWCCCGLLADSPRVLAIAGVAAGFGFMTIENAGYVIAAASQPPTVYLEDYPAGEEPNADKMNGGTMTVLTIVTIFVRVVLNIHPWLTGLSAARVAEVAFKDDTGLATACIGPPGMIKAIVPSALIHASYDFLLVATPGYLAICMPLVFWLISRALFRHYWPAQTNAELEFTRASGPLRST